MESSIRYILNRKEKRCIVNFRELAGITLTVPVYEDWKQSNKDKSEIELVVRYFLLTEFGRCYIAVVSGVYQVKNGQRDWPNGHDIRRLCF